MNVYKVDQTITIKTSAYKKAESESAAATGCNSILYEILQGYITFSDEDVSIESKARELTIEERRELGFYVGDEKPNEKFVIWLDVDLNTDGDFKVCNIDKYGTPERDAEDVAEGRSHWSDGENYSFHREYCGILPYSTKNVAIEFLEDLLTDIHVDASHYFIIPDLYAMFDSAMHFIRADDTWKDTETFRIGGNYYGTMITVTMRREDE